MQTIRLTFPNKEGLPLSARLEMPLDRKPHNFVIFVHCFTCNKSLTPILHISRELAREGFGVLRFDFTGLGESEGDFSDTNFSGNVSDIIAAAEFLKEHHRAPALLIGHSFGGAAALFAAAKLPEVRAVATIAAPSDPEHVRHLLKENEAEILAKGRASVQLEGRDFTIKKQFLEDLKEHALTALLDQFRKPILILHAPQDNVVDIQNAEQLFVAAHHPRSFISLDGADHLLSRPEDALYVGKTIAAWSSRYVNTEADTLISSDKHVAASLDGNAQFTTVMRLGQHSFIADEPIAFGGNDLGPTPYDYLSGGLAACTAMTIQMYARRKKWPVDNVTVHVAHGREHAPDCEACETKDVSIDLFTRSIVLEGNLDQKQRNRLLLIADRCPVHKTLQSQAEIITRLEEPGSD